MEEELEGTLVLEKLVGIGAVQEFFDAIDRDDFRNATLLMKSAGVDESTIARVLQKMASADGER